ncbi:unnamed protein product [Heligmosomoides polygyrus]|uniref:Secreted protein n=1 Tax=Heligmosomoides polygyrus TaxID=6339 RepID=A0A183FN49_HELPZ|nr:unnamed protein product [Heligmosomoides polygyrus]
MSLIPVFPSLLASSTTSSSPSADLSGTAFSESADFCAPEEAAECSAPEAPAADPSSSNRPGRLTSHSASPSLGAAMTNRCEHSLDTSYPGSVRSLLEIFMYSESDRLCFCSTSSSNYPISGGEMSAFAFIASPSLIRCITFFTPAKTTH